VICVIGTVEVVAASCVDGRGRDQGDP
jgi:hypothetical protein